MLSLLNSLLEQPTPLVVILSYASEIIFWLVGHIFLAIALTVMAKNLNIKKRWMAWVPFVNYLIMGKIVGNAVVWGKRIKNVGLWAMVFSIAQTVINFTLNMGAYLYDIGIVFNVDFLISNEFLYGWLSGTSFFYDAVYYVSFVIDIAFIFFEISLIFLIFRLYAGQRALVYSILSIFFSPLLFGILLFVVRNNERKSFKQYYTVYNGYSNFNGNGYGGFNQPNNNQPKPNDNQDVDPFPEFSGDKDGNSSKTDDDDIFS